MSGFPGERRINVGPPPPFMGDRRKSERKPLQAPLPAGPRPAYRALIRSHHHPRLHRQASDMPKHARDRCRQMPPSAVLPRSPAYAFASPEQV